jgi:hypothetical protein
VSKAPICVVVNDTKAALSALAAINRAYKERNAGCLTPSDATLITDAYKPLADAAQSMVAGMCEPAAIAFGLRGEWERLKKALGECV